MIIGGGFAGCASAHQLALLEGWDVTLVEVASFLGAGVRTRWHGGHPYTFGPRHFLTENEEVYSFLNRYVPLRRLDHQFLTYVECDQDFYNFPIHRDDINRMSDREKIRGELKTVSGALNAKNLEEYWINSVGTTLYEKFIKKYNQKMWLVDDNRELDTFEWSQKVSLTTERSKAEDEQLPENGPIKEGPREAYDTSLSGYPHAANGYDDYFDIATQETRVLLSTRIEQYDIPNKSVWLEGKKHSFDIIISTISPDTLFDRVYGELPFIGRDFHKIVLPVEDCFPDNVFFLYYANDEPFTRLVEYKKLTLHKSPTTLIGMEIPSMNGKHYPIPIRAEQAKAQKYLDELPEDVFSIGRAGSYDYNVDIDDCIEQAMSVADAVRVDKFVVKSSHAD